MRLLHIACAIVWLAVAAVMPAVASEWQHGLSMMGQPKYPAGFKHFSYVRPDAPKGGVVRMAELGTFDTFNPLLAKGSAADGLGYVFERLMVPSLDEVSTEYGLLAEAVKVGENYSSVSYRLRAEARWHDGKPVTAEDVVWTFEAMRKHNPQMALYYQNVKSVEAKGAREVLFVFDKPGNRELPQIVGQILVLPKHWWTGVGADGKPRDIGAGTLEPPLGSGPYRLKSFSSGRSVAYERVPDYWGKALAVNVGQHNFDEIRIEYFRDETVAMEGFKGDAYDFRLENIARLWATAYDFPAKTRGDVVLETFPERARGIMQAFAFNLRRDKFADVRVRQAFNLVFDYEDMNKTLFFGQYTRINSYFYGSELSSEGLPQGKELALLEPLRGKVPPSVFTAPYANPVNGSPEATRANTRRALQLLQEAGWSVQQEGGKPVLKNKAGQPFEVEFLLSSPSFERVIGAYKPALERLGVVVKSRTVDASQYVTRLRSRDYDVIVFSWGQSLSPGNEQREYWGSEAAKREGSRNMAGIADPAIDALVDQVIFAKTREDLVAATKALDRVLLAHHFVVPQWSSAVQRTARWNRFGHPDPVPPYSIGFPNIWWFDAAKAAKVKP